MATIPNFLLAAPTKHFHLRSQPHIAHVRNFISAPSCLYVQTVHCQGFSSTGGGKGASGSDRGVGVAKGIAGGAALAAMGAGAGAGAATGAAGRACDIICCSCIISAIIECICCSICIFESAAGAGAGGAGAGAGAGAGTGIGGGACIIGMPGRPAKPWRGIWCCICAIIISMPGGEGIGKPKGIGGICGIGGGGCGCGTGRGAIWLMLGKTMDIVGEGEGARLEALGLLAEGTEGLGAKAASNVEGTGRA